MKTKRFPIKEYNSNFGTLFLFRNYLKDVQRFKRFDDSKDLKDLQRFERFDDSKDLMIRRIYKDLMI